MIKDFAELLRVQQYVKNLFLFLPMFFAMELTDFNILLKVFFGFVSFCLIASSVYILNDINDIKVDKKHPLKKFRPIPARKISIRNAYIVFAICLLLGGLIAVNLSLNFSLILAGYFLINVFYSIKLKNLSIIDLFIVAIGFVLRIFAGSSLAGIITSKWIIIMTFLLALFLALAKRHDDLILYNNGRIVRKNISQYNLTFINVSMAIMASIVLVTYIMYTVSPEVIAQFGSGNIYWTAFFVLTGIMRYLQITFVEEKSVSPTKIFLSDKFIQFSLLGWILTFAILIY
ncbi:MAG: UbiA prenyltransferase family protein [Candidatus Gastranaerophilales bacterium]|nr:UbiA prenyltransferase family protein [Candidatus Gastranaerophilales bacterium]